MKPTQVKKNSPSGRAQAQPPRPMDVAMRMLGRRALSSTELCERLEQRGFDAEVCAGIRARLEDFGYLNDQNLAVSIVQQAQREGRGPLWVRRTLHRRRISPAVLQRTNADEMPTHDTSDVEAATRLVRRRFTDLQDIKVKQRAMRFLCNRGFTPPVALGILGAVRTSTSGEL